MPAQSKIQSGQTNIRAEIIAAGYAAIGEVDEAFAWLEKACDARSAGMIYFAVEPAYATLRTDPRFDAMVRKVGLVARTPLGQPNNA